MINKKSILVLTFIIISIFSLICKDIVGVVSDLEGELIHRFGGNEKKLEIGDEIYKNSNILKGSTKNASINIITLSGDKKSSTFPLNDFSEFTVMDDDTADMCVEFIGGTVLRNQGKPKGKGVDSIFEWDMEVGVVAESDIKKKGMKLIMSKNESSFSKKNYIPLVFKLKNVEIKSVDYKILQSNNNLIENEGTLKSENGNFIFDFACFNYSINVGYEVNCTFNLENDKSIEYKFTYRVFDGEAIEFIESKLDDNGVNETEYNNQIKKAVLFNKYSLNTRRNQLLTDLGIGL